MTGDGNNYLNEGALHPEKKLGQGASRNVVAPQVLLQPLKNGYIIVDTRV